MRNGTSNHEDPALDALVRAAAERGDDDDFGVDEAVLLDYLNGRADEKDAAVIREALSGSATLRRRLAEIAADLERLASPEMGEAFSSVEVRETPDRAAYLGEETAGDDGPAWKSQTYRHFRTDQPSLLDLLRSLFLKPAFAYVFTAALLAFPTIRYFTMSRSGPPLVASLRIHHLQTEELTLRGAGNADLPVIARTPDDRPLALALWSETPLRPGLRYDVTVGDDRHEVYHDTDFPIAYDPADPTRIDLQIDTRHLASGRIAIRIVRHVRDTGETLLSEEYAFRLE